MYSSNEKKNIAIFLYQCERSEILFGRANMANNETEYYRGQEDLDIATISHGHTVQDCPRSLSKIVR